MGMKYQLSFCEIEQLSESIFEVTTVEGAVVDQNCAREANDFWINLRSEPFSLLVNNKNSFSFSFTGSVEIAKNPLRKKTAVLLSSKMTEGDVRMTLDIKKSANFSEQTRLFDSRTGALQWLSVDEAQA